MPDTISGIVRAKKVKSIPIIRDRKKFEGDILGRESNMIKNLERAVWVKA